MREANKKVVGRIRPGTPLQISPLPRKEPGARLALLYMIDLAYYLPGPVILDQGEHVVKSGITEF